MNKITKFIVGASLAAFALVASASTASAAYMHTGLLKQGMTSSQVMSLQTTLNASGFLVSTTGAGSPGMESSYFGSKTKAAVMAFQTAKGLTADGIVGAQTGTALAAMTGGSMSYPAGCSSTSGYSTVNGQPCTMTANYPVGCMSNSGYSTTTGQPCTGASLPAGCMSTAGFSPISGVSCSTGGSSNGALSGSTGNISSYSLLSSVDNQVGEGNTDKKVVGVEIKADAGSDLNISAMRVTFKNTNSPSSSKRFDRYAKTVSVWAGSTKVGSASISDFSEDSGLYTKTINLSGATVKADQKSQFYVTVDAVSNIDSGDFTNTFVATIDNARFNDASGAILTETFSSPTITKTFSFVSLATANDLELKVNLASDNMKATTVKVSTTSNTNNVQLLKFTVKAQGGKMHIDQIPVYFAASTALSEVTGNVTLKINGDTFTETIASTTATGATITFDNLSFDISADDTVTGTVYADINDIEVPYFNQGDTLKASITSSEVAVIDAEDANGDNIQSGDRSGSAVGEVMTFRSTGVNAVMGDASITRDTDQNGNIVQVHYSIPVSVTSFGNTLYLGQSAQLAATATGSNAFALVYEASSAGSTPVVGGTSSITLSSSDSSIDTNGFRLDDGQTKHFTITVNLIDPATASTSYRVHLDQIRTFTDALLTAGAANSDLLPIESYRTNYQLINS